mgnify:FL=1
MNLLDDAKIESSLELEPQTFSKQSHQFWILQFAGWLGYALFVFVAIIRPQFSDPAFNFSGQILNLLVETFSGFLLSFLQWHFIRRIIHFPLKKMLFLSFAFAAILGVVYNIIKLSTFKVIVFEQQWNHAWNMLEFGGWLLFSLTTMFAWTSIFFIMLYNTKLQKEHEMLLRAQTAAKDAQLQMLRYQLNPHFMFNTMNAISTLIYKHENDKANEMLDKLCEFFRYTLDQNANSNTTLQKELALLDLYLTIEKVRFGDRLTINMEINAATLFCQVPSMLLQPLVENSIKYAIEPRKEAGLITISSIKQQDRLILTVIDNGNGEYNNVSTGFGIGISNTKARLDAMFSGDYNITIYDNDYNGKSVEISMPFEKLL